MTVNVANTELTNTFEYWRARTNELANAMSTTVVTVNSNTATGNAAITGKFTANNLFAADIHGNTFISVNVSTINSSSTDNFSYINTTSISVGNNDSNTSIIGNAITTKNVYVGTNVAINVTAFFVGTTTSNASLSNAQLTVQSNDIVNSVLTSAKLTLSNGSVNSSLGYNSLVMGNTTINSIAVSTNTVGANIVSTGAAGFTANLTRISMGSNVYVNTSALYVTDTSATSTVNSIAIVSGGDITAAGNAQISGSYANVAGTLFVRGDLVVNGNMSYTGTSNADILPVSNLFSLGSTTKRWTLYAMDSYNANSVFVGTSTVNATLNSTSLAISNSTAGLTLSVPTASQISNGSFYLNANGSWTATPTTNSSVTTTGTSAQQIDSYQMSIIPGAEYTISVVDNNANNRYMSKILTTHDRTTGFMTEYAQITTNTSVGTFSFAAAGNATHVVLSFTPVSTNTTVKVIRTIL